MGGIASSLAARRQWPCERVGSELVIRRSPGSLLQELTWACVEREAR